MNANDLADRLEQFYTGTHIDKAAETLRQQQAEIEQLRKIVEDTIGQAFYEDDYHKAQAEIEQLKALIISMSPNANLIYTKASKK
jgi:hypothetical protein